MYCLFVQLSPDAKYEELTITVNILDEEFTSSGKNTISNGWTELMPWKQIDTKEMPSLREGDFLEIGSVNIFIIKIREIFFAIVIAIAITIANQVDYQSLYPGLECRFLNFGV